jgi:uncharacterized NAD-dependent epimerase/dehydratase family protein
MPARIVVLTEGNTNPLSGKTAASVIRYRPDEVVAVLDSTAAGRTAQELLGVGGDLPIVAALADAPPANTLLIGIAPAGGKVPDAWRPILLEAIARKMSIVSGLHDFLGDDPELAAAAETHGVTIHDVRRSDQRQVARQQGIRDDCLRILTVGLDCSVGKMVTAIEITRCLQQAGHLAKFVATGQTGILVEGDGCSVDCVVADFISGAAEHLILANQHHDILVFEGQGSLYHPSYSGVTLGLLHGSQPDGLILCYEVGRTGARGMSHVPLPSLAEAKQFYELAARAMHPGRVIGVAMNSSTLTEAEADAEGQRVTTELQLPACDVFRHGPQPLADAVLNLKEELGK